MTAPGSFGLPCQHCLALEMDRNVVPHPATQGTDHEALTGFDIT